MKLVRKKALSPYMALNKAKADFCKGKTTKTVVKAKAKAYMTSAVKSGNHTKASAEKIAKKVLNRGCTMTSAIGKKKSTPASRKKKVSGELTIKHGVGKRKTARRATARKR